MWPDSDLLTMYLPHLGSAGRNAAHPRHFRWMRISPSESYRRQAIKLSFDSSIRGVSKCFSLSKRVSPTVKIPVDLIIPADLHAVCSAAFYDGDDRHCRSIAVGSLL